VSSSGNQWQVLAPTTSGSVNPVESTNIPVTVFVPYFAPDGASDSVQISVSSQGDRSEIMTATLTTHVDVIGELNLIALPQIVK
jgi:hypothetical protein